jgi:hypothetical protein
MKPQAKASVAAKRLENKARRLWGLRLLPGAWQYMAAEGLWNKAQAMKKAAC